MYIRTLDLVYLTKTNAGLIKEVIFNSLTVVVCKGTTGVGTMYG